MPRVWVAFLLGLLSLAAHANVVDSDSWLVQRTAHAWLDLLEKELGTPNTPIPADQAVVAIELSGTSLRVLIVGPISGKAMVYATALDHWRTRENLPGDVRYSQEDDCAAAAWEFNRTQLWKTSAQLEVELRSLTTALSRVEEQVSLTATVRRASAAQAFPAPAATTSGGTKLWKFDTPGQAPEVVSAKTTAGPYDGLFAILWLVFMPVVSWIIAPLTWFISTRFGSNVVEKRQLYIKFLMRGVFGAIGVHALWSVFVLTSRTFDPIAQIWFAARFSSLAIPVVMLGLPIGLVPIFILMKWEKKLFGPAEGEPVVERKRVLAEVDPDGEKKTNRTKLWISLGCLALGLPFYFLPQLLPKGAPLREFGSMIGVLIILILPMAINALVDRRRQKVVDADPRVAELTARLQSRAEIANRAMGTAVQVKLDTRPLNALSAYAQTQNRVAIGVDMVAMLTDEELDHIIAHELAHVKLKHPRNRLLITFAPMLVMVPVLFLVNSPELFRSVSRFMLLVPFLFVIPFFALSRARKKQELICDEMAVRALGNKEAAKAALRKVTAGSSMPGLHTVDTDTHPSVQKRLEAIDRIQM